MFISMLALGGLMLLALGTAGLIFAILLVFRTSESRAAMDRVYVNARDEWAAKQTQTLAESKLSK